MSVGVPVFLSYKFINSIYLIKYYVSFPDLSIDVYIFGDTCSFTVVLGSFHRYAFRDSMPMKRKRGIWVRKRVYLPYLRKRSKA